MSEEYSVAGRRFLKEKVVTSYEKLWAGQEINYPELFLLKAHAQWLHSHIASEPASQLLGPRKPIVRRLFAECCDSVSEEATADVQSHAMETLAGIFLGVGSRSFHDPVAEVPELLCGIEAADAIFGRLFAHVKRIISSERRGGGAVALRRSAVRMLLSLTAAASDLHSNILVDLLMPHGFDQPSAPTRTRPSPLAPRPATLTPLTPHLLHHFRHDVDDPPERRGSIQRRHDDAAHLQIV